MTQGTDAGAAAVARRDRGARRREIALLGDLPPMSLAEYERLVATLPIRPPPWWVTHARPLVILVVVIALIGWMGLFSARALVASAPVWWRAVDDRSPEVGEAARLFQNAIVEQVTRRRAAPASGPAGPRSEAWSIAIAPAGANAWLNATFPGWLTGSGGALEGWPDDWHTLQVAFEGGRLHIGIEVDRPEGRRVYSAAFRTHLDEGGSLWFRTESLAVGRLALPATVALPAGERLARTVALEDLAGSLGPDTIDAFVDRLMGEHPIAVEPLVHLGDGRAVRLVGLRIVDERLVATFRTEILAARDGAIAAATIPIDR